MGAPQSKLLSKAAMSPRICPISEAPPGGAAMVAELQHGVTRFRIRLVCYLAECRSSRVPSRGGLRWVRPGEFENYPLSMTGRKLAGILRHEPCATSPSIESTIDGL